MSTGQKILWAVIVVIIIVGGYWWWSSSQSMNSTPATGTNSEAPMIPATSTSTQSGAGVSVGASTNTAPMSATVTFNGTSFSPSSVTIAQGGTVTWVSTDGTMWVASDPHPIHNGYDGTTMQQHCAPGYAGAAPFDECTGSNANWSFTFDKVGTWGYHDHLAASIMGSVTVVAQ